MVSVLGRFFVVGRGSLLLLLLLGVFPLPLLVGAVPLGWVWVVSVDISRSVPDD
jgi:hypothetical protein